MLLDGNGLIFNFNFAAGTPQNVQNAVVAAGNLWSANFKDDVTLNVDFSYEPLGEGTGAQTAPFKSDIGYSFFRSKLAADAKSSQDTSAIASLPTGSSFGLYMNRTSDNPHGNDSATPYVDGGTEANNTTVKVHTAVQKAIGIRSPRDSFLDGTIVFNSDVPWDFNRSDGIAPGQVDLAAAIAHELGHVMGFVSGAEALDRDPGSAAATYRVTQLDFYRYSSASAAAGVIDFTSDARDKYFSLDGGTTSLAALSTGSNGDGNESSHWKDGMNLGLMDPSLTAGKRTELSIQDVKAMDVIGWDRELFSTNPTNRFDVNNDGYVSPIDPLIIINLIDIGVGPSWDQMFYYDVNEDGFVSPIDVLQVINYIEGLLPEGEASASVNWGSIGYARNDNVSVHSGDLYEFTTTRAGIVTVEALFSHAGGNVNLELYSADNLFSPLASSNSTTNNERIDFSTAAGQTYFVRALGSNPNVDFVVANLVAVNGSVVDVAGTNAADTFSFTAGANYSVVANGVAYSYPASSVSQVAFHGAGGSDSIVVTGSASRDTAYLYPKSMTVYGSGYVVTTDNLETQRIYSSGGSDYAYFYDSAGNDTFGGRQNSVYMYGSGFANYAYNFYGVYAYATNGYDRTYFYDTAGNDTYLTTSTYSYMYGSGYVHYASGFDSVYAYATLGGYDQAYFYDSSSNDYFYGRSNYAYISGGGTFRYGRGFDAVYAYGYYGGTNTYNVSGVDYYFGRYGSWLPA